MLCTNSYTEKCANAFRASVATQLSTYQALAAVAVDGGLPLTPGESDRQVARARKSFVCC